MKKYLAGFIMLLLVGCGSGDGDKNSKPSVPDFSKGTFIYNDLGSYIGAIKVDVVLPDGSIKDRLYSLYTTRVSQGVYVLGFNPSDFNSLFTYRIEIERLMLNGEFWPTYRNNIYYENVCNVYFARIDNPNVKYKFVCYVPGEIYG